ncbi:MAG: hypothetical protein MEQ84_06550 [Mesorhizobium sp.]|nr:hypothetical protein [Mesorhizobium sp.]
MNLLGWLAAVLAILFDRGHRVRIDLTFFAGLMARPRPAGSRQPIPDVTARSLSVDKDK